MSYPSSANELELQGLQADIKKSASWFYWIGALSLINSLIIAFNGELSFIVGLGITQIVDGIAWASIQEGAPEFVKYVALAISFIISGGFALFAIAGNKRMLPVYIIGIILYGLDALIFLAFQDWLPVAFHAFAIFNLWKAISHIKEYRQLQATIAASEEPEVVSAV